MLSASVIAYSSGSASDASTGALAGSIGAAMVAWRRCQRIACPSLGCGSPAHSTLLRAAMPSKRSAFQISTRS
jgi:hypothetical protein